MKANPTTVSYTSLTTAYDFFNKELFSGFLPPCLLTLQRHKGSFGYFSAGRFANTDEIALNPVHFNRRKPSEVLSTLVHEMTHLWRSREGNPPRQGYHERVWAEKLASLGLIPSATGKVRGARTGQHITHYIEPGGLYEQKTSAILKEHPAVLYADRADELEELHAKREAKAASKTKYSCPSCKLNAWAKPHASLICGSCSVALIADKPLSLQSQSKSIF